MPSLEQKLQAREKERKIIELRLRGVQVDQIAREFHVRPQRISFLVKRALKQIPAPVAEQERTRQIAILERVAQHYWTMVQENQGDWQAQDRGLQGVLRVEQDRRHMLALQLPASVVNQVAIVGGLTEPTAIALRRVLFEGLGSESTPALSHSNPDNEETVELQAMPVNPARGRSAADQIDDILKGQ